MSYRVRINTKNYHGGKPWRLGTAPFIPREGQCWDVLWDGLKSRTSYAKDFIEIVDGGDSMLYFEGGWHEPENFVRHVYETITINCNDPKTVEKTLGLMREKFK
jgi:hypothetical protein